MNGEGERKYRYKKEKSIVKKEEKEEKNVWRRKYQDEAYGRK